MHHSKVKAAADAADAVALAVEVVPGSSVSELRRIIFEYLAVNVVADATSTRCEREQLKATANRQKSAASIEIH